MPPNEYTTAWGTHRHIPLKSDGAQFDSDQDILNAEYRSIPLDDLHLQSVYSKFLNEPLWVKPWWVQPSQVQATFVTERYNSPSISWVDFADDQDVSEVDKRTYTCFYLLGSALALLFASIGLSIGWSISSGDVSGGVGMGSYMLAISSVIIAVATYMHRSSCRCWVRRRVSPP
ncbi:uncharacterized protein F4812DRAFT_460909 [Daldinia caldariorum]|uniref:uncharacterized protein n=1 Tax=Daldinia caldariorum TaxID=326644 RepID=UPI002008D0B7|nr:uncharacterized protein F4812DRAFT_460909 [Daldinia caldariorum]KAI1465930.1 hypothetical protein F4812DRAFT_460909 [Daldinia caldariorum]